jgi:hypothetical protein
MRRGRTMAVGVTVGMSVRMAVVVGMSMIHGWMLYYNITEVHAWARSQTGLLAAPIARGLLRFHPKEGAGDPKEGRRRPKSNRV